MKQKQEPVIETRYTAASLLATDFPEPKWIVPGIIPEGLTILGGNPKLGKSWLMLGTAIAVAVGGVALGKIDVEEGEVLYLALEDNPRRLKMRLQKILQGGALRRLQNLHIETEWQRTNEGGLARLAKWLEDHPAARLVVIDTLQKVKPRRKGGGNIYEEDSDDVGALQTLASRFAVAIIVVHHLRKADGLDPVEMLSGSYGLSGAADGILILRRERGQADASLFLTGRDVDESTNALEWKADLGLWSLLGDAAEFRMTTERQEVLNALRSIGHAVTPKQLFEQTGVGKSQAALKQMLWRMAGEGELQNVHGYYSIT